MNKLNLIRCGLRLSAATVIGLAPLAALAQPAPPAPPTRELREQVENLRQQAQALRSAGRPEASQPVANQSEVVARMLERREMERGSNPGEGAPGAGRDEFRGRLERLRARLAELQQRDQAVRAEARQVRRQIQEAQGGPSGGARPPGPREPEGMPGIGPGQSPPPPPMGRPEPRPRLRHLQAAIDHLRAAGLQDVADALAHEARRMQPPFGPGLRPGLPGPDAPPMGGELRQLRQQLQDLRQAVHDLRRQVDELSPDRR